MTTIRPISPLYAVAPAPGPGFFEDAKTQGFAMIINNRPDGEDPAQLSSLQAKAAAEAAGLRYMHIPVSGMPGPEQAAALSAVLATNPGPILAFCRSGTRSAATFCLAQAGRGADIQETLALVRTAGYDLAQLEPLMERLAPR